MGAAFLRQPLGGRLQHDPLRHRDRAQAFDIVGRHHAGIEMRQEPGLLEHQRCHGGEVVQRGGVAELVEGAARCGVTQFRLVAEGEQGFVAAGALSRARDREHVIGGEIGGFGLPRRLREGAVVATVAAKLGEWNEHLARIGDVGAMAAVAQRSRGLHQERQIVTVGERQRFHRGWRVSPARPIEHVTVRRRRHRPPPLARRAGAACNRSAKSSTARASASRSARLLISVGVTRTGKSSSLAKLSSAASITYPFRMSP